MTGQTVVVGKQEVSPGTRTTVELEVANLYTHANLTMPVHVINGRAAGPTLFLTAAIHGDELNGVEIIKRVMKRAVLKSLRGCILAVPVVNVFGFIEQSRYLPDRRDLNRSFPGRVTGSLAARLAHMVATEIVANSNFGIDLHTGAVHRTNFPQIRANLSEPDSRRMANAFGAPVVIDANVREGTLRAYAGSQGVPTLLYESGEALRLDELSIEAGVNGVIRVLRELDMLPAHSKAARVVEPTYANDTSWVRAPMSGIINMRCRLGQRVKSQQVLAKISDPFGEIETDVVAPAGGIVIGRSTSPLTHEGDALFNLARFDDTREAKATVDEFQEANAVEHNWG
ncbi:MAG TPA: succinylglutamate desuccinylase/aspartoacylase family protein [Woeseiaceae bacterium]|nr:succinylglutamate desuccinylase/aspartoacylase family protein [Woeseiaceae bacterium]